VVTRAVFRFRNYTIMPDSSGLPTYVAVCVSGAEEECGDSSSERTGIAEVDRWIAEHVRDTGHVRFRRTYANYAVAEPGEWQ
jgi:hypothetical protein